MSAFHVVALCESVVHGFPTQWTKKGWPPDFAQGAESLFVLNRVVSSVVILVQFPVDLRSPSRNTDPQNIAKLLLFVVTPPTNGPHGVQGVAGSNPAVPTSGSRWVSNGFGSERVSCDLSLSLLSRLGPRSRGGLVGRTCQR